MTQDVLVTISGLHITDEAEMNQNDNEPIELIAPAKYYLKNGKHYIIYDEMMDDFPEMVKNKVKITGDSQLEIIKTGLVNAHMVFEEGKSNVTFYETPFGKMHTEMHTRCLNIRITETQIDIDVDYQLDVGGAPAADCRILMNIKSKNE